MTNKTQKTHTAQHIQKKSWMKSTAISPTSFLVAGLALTGSMITANTAYAVGVNVTPTGENVVAGTATVNRPTTGVLNVTQSSQRVVIDWDHFNIGKNATTEFFQPNATSTAVNRVVGPNNDPTKIMGTLRANGNVMILDSNGILFGKNSVVDVGGLIASTGDIDVNSFMNGDMQITLDGVDTGSVINKGAISIKDGGLLAFVAPHVANRGTITAKLGRVSLAAGKKAVLDFSGDQLVQIALSDELENALVENAGEIIARGSRVELTARAAKGAVDSVINMDGIIKADSFDVKDGKIILDGGNNGKVTVAGTIENKGRIANRNTRNAAIGLGLADGTEERKAKGGSVSIYGQAVDLTNTANINTSGTHGGGTVSIGNATTSSVSVADGARIITRALQYGNAGTVNISSLAATDFSGFIDARGGATEGNGGQVNISSAGQLTYNGTVDTSAANGQMGTLTLDPADIIVWDGFGAAPLGSVVNAQALVQTLGLSNVHIIAGNSITLIDDLDLSHYNLGVDVTTGDLILTSNTVSLNDLTMGTGDVFMNAGTVNLSGTIFGSDGSVIDATRLHNTATVVNVLSNEARIQQAIDMALTGTSVNVSGDTGPYQENVVVNKTISLSGYGSKAPVLMGVNANGDVILVTADNVSVSGFDIRGEIVGTADKSANGIVSRANGTEMRFNTISDMARAGIVLSGGANNIVETNVIEGGDQYGVLAYNTTTSAIRINNIVNTGSHGIYANHNSALSMSSNTIQGAGTHGIYVRDNGARIQNIIFANTISDAARDGIYVTGATNALISINTINDAGSAAIRLMNSTALTPEINGNIINRPAGHGIVVDNVAGNSVIVGYNTIHNAGLNGIQLKGADAGYRLLSNQIFAAGQHGINVDTVDQYSGSANLVDGAGLNGLNFTNATGVVTSEHGTFRNNTYDGVSIANSAGVKIDGALIQGNGGQGIDIDDSNNVDITFNRIMNGANNAITVSGGRDVALENNTISDFGLNGIVAENQVAELTVNWNRIYGVVNDGIQLRNIDDATVHGNGTDNSTAGSIGRDFININGGQNNRISNNVIRTNGFGTTVGRDGVHVENDTNSIIETTRIEVANSFFPPTSVPTTYAPYLAGNSAVGRDGIYVANSTGTTVSANTISANNQGVAANRHGIYVNQGTNVTVSANRISGSVGLGMPFPPMMVGDAAGAGQDGIHVLNSTGTDIRDNDIYATTFLQNGMFPPAQGVAYGAKRHGIYVGNSTDTDIERNDIFATNGESYPGSTLMPMAVLEPTPMPTPEGTPMPTSEPTPMPTGMPGNTETLAAAGAGEHGIYVANSTDTEINQNNIYTDHGHMKPSKPVNNAMFGPGYGGGVTQQIFGAVKNAIYVTGNRDTSIMGNAIEARNNFFGPAVAAMGMYPPFMTVSYTGAGQHGIYANNETNLSITSNRIGADGSTQHAGVKQDGIFVENSRRAFIGNNSFFAAFSAIAAGRHGIHTVNARGVDIIDNNFRGITSGIAAGQNGIHVIDSNNADIVSNSFFGGDYGLATGRDGIYLNNSAGSLIAYNSVGLGKKSKALMMGASTVFGRNGITVDNSANAMIRDNHIAHTVADGIRVHQSDNSRIQDNEIENTGENGIVLTADEGTKILRNTVSDTALRGIHVFNSIENVIKNNIVRDTDGFGIYVHKSGYASVIGNDTYDTAKAGIRIEETDHATVKRNNVYNSFNYNGINVIDSDDAVIRGNYVSEAILHGIRIADSARASVINNEIYDAGHEGIRVINSDDATLQGNDIYAGSGNGIHVTGSDRIQIVDNDVRDQNGYGIYLKRSDDASIRDNTTSDLRDDHIRLDNSDDAEILNNDLRENGYRLRSTASYMYGNEHDGIKLVNSDDALIQGNDIRDMSDDGIDLENSNGARIIDNDIHNAMDDGIDIEGGRDIRIASNDVIDARDNGLEITDARKLHIEGNLIRGSGNEGILADYITNARIHNNRIIDTSSDGMNIGDATNVRVTKNVVRDAGDEGIEFDRSSNVRVINNRIIDTGDAIEFDNVDDFVIARNKIKDAWDGIDIDNVNDGLVLANIISDVRSYGIRVDDAEAIDIHNNEIRNLAFPEPTPEPTPEGTPSPTSMPQMVDPDKGGKGYRATGIYVSDSDDISIQRNIVNNTATGIRLHNTDEVTVAENLLNGNHVGFHAEGSENEDMTFDGNVFVNNQFGAIFNSGIVTFAGVNQFVGGDTALIFSPVPMYDMYDARIMDEQYPGATQEPEMEWSRLELVDNTIGETSFEGQSNFYIQLENGAFFDPDQPTVIDASEARFDGVDGGLMTAAELQAIEDMIRDYDDLDTLGQIFAGFTGSIDPSDLFFDGLADLLEFNTQGRVTIVNLPFIPGANGTIDPADLARLAPAAGGEDETDPESLSNMEPASGEEEVKCWAQLGQKVGSGAVTFNFDASPEAILAGQAACSDL